MDKNKLVIGVLGGMGPYATVDFYRRLVDAFPTEKDWQKPRIIIDSYAPIPSRVRALLYGERTEELLECMESSLKGLLFAGANRIIIACNTAHAFLPELLMRVPEGKGYVLNLITLCVKEIRLRGYGRVHLFASEGTIQSGIYEKAFEGSGIQIEVPDEVEMRIIRKLMEDVKQNQINGESLQCFIELVSGISIPCILGCTELPVLYGQSRNICDCTDRVVDPLQIAIDVLTEGEPSGFSLSMDSQRKM